MFCGKYGIENRDDLAFCTKCGSELARQAPVPRKTDSSTLSDQKTVVAPEADEDTFSKGLLYLFTFCFFFCIFLPFLFKGR